MTRELETILDKAVAALAFWPHQEAWSMRESSASRPLTCEKHSGYQVVYFFEDGAPRCRLTAIAIDEAARGRGAGPALLAATEARASAADCFVLEATSANRPERAASHRFYPRQGFTDGGEQSTYYRKAIG